jgi:hypothetical protein
VYKENRPKICFLCLGEEGLLLADRISFFSTLEDLSKHFERKHLQHIKSKKSVNCNLCKVFLVNKMHLQQHALDLYETVTPKAFL